MSGTFRRTPAGPGPARHERPEIDEAALAAARAADYLLADARARNSTRWMALVEPLPELLRDAGIVELRRVALRARAAYGPKDSIRDALGHDVTEPFLEAIDRLLKVIARRDAAQ